MAFLVGVFEGDFDAFKQQFDSDPLGRRQAAKGHTMLRGVDNPNEIFLRVEFEWCPARTANAVRVAHTRRVSAPPGPSGAPAGPAAQRRSRPRRFSSPYGRAAVILPMRCAE